MLFVPYKLDLSLYRIPFITLLVCVVCVVTFSNQLSSSSAYAQRLNHYCQQDIEPNLQAMLDGAAEAGGYAGCIGTLLAIRRADDRDSKIAEMATTLGKLVFYTDKATDLQYKTAKLSSGYADFELSVPDQLTNHLQYNPEQHNFIRMLTSSFAHADWEHLLGNLFFFFVFAASLESAIGYVYFASAFVLMAVASSLGYSLSVADSNALPTIGLSGVVMGMMAMITALMPKARIWCLFWIFLFVRRFTLPLYVITLWYIGWNVYDQLNNDGSSNINYMAHVSGALSGLALGALYWIFHRQRMHEIEMEMST